MERDAEAARRWRGAMEVFLEALDREGADREAFVARECARDAALEHAVRRLLETDREVTSTELPDLAAVRAASLGVESLVGETLGAYRVVSKLGDGGMGSVYLAERRDGRFDQQVAIKVLRTGLKTPDRVRRFESERRILARLSHPAIARLLDGGETANGLPYLVMEYVPGRAILEHAEELALSVERKLELFLQVCSALEYAHRNLVIHRDIKPSNILIDEEGAPKLLDFGIAKLLPEELEASEGVPATIALTPDYASPEQILGQSLTTTTDVYSAGVLLYELLSGSRPFQRAERGTTLEAALKAPPVPPGERSRAGHGRFDRDLDAIVLKSLAFEPEERYRTIGRFADDIRAYQEGRPVRAVAGNAIYRLRKFARRNRLASASLILVVALTTAYVTSALLQAQRVREERDVAAQVTRFLVESYERVDPSQARGATLTAREVLDDAARRIDGELAGQTIVKSRLQKTLAEVYWSLGLYPAADELIAEARSLLEGADRADSKDYAEVRLLQGHLLHQQARNEEALAEVAVARNLFQRLGDGVADARSQHLEAWIYWDQGDRARALAHDREANESERKLLGADHVQTLEGAFAVTRRLALLGRSDEAAPLQDEIIRRLEGQGLRTFPLTGEVLRQVAVRERKGGRLRDAELLFERALEVQRSLYGDRHPTIARTLSGFGNLRRRQGRYDEALALFDEALGMSEQVFGADDNYGALIRFNRGVLMQHMGRHEEAAVDMRRALDMKEAILGEQSWETANTAIFLLGYAEALISLERWDEALSAAERSLAVWRTRDQLDTRNGCLARAAIAAVEIERGALDRAMSELELCYPVIEHSAGVLPIQVERVRDRLVALYRRLGRDDLAVGLGPTVAS